MPSRTTAKRSSDSLRGLSIWQCRCQRHLQSVHGRERAGRQLNHLRGLCNRDCWSWWHLQQRLRCWHGAKCRPDIMLVLCGRLVQHAWRSLHRVQYSRASHSRPSHMCCMHGWQQAERWSISLRGVSVWSGRAGRCLHSVWSRDAAACRYNHSGDDRRPVCGMWSWLRAGCGSRFVCRVRDRCRRTRWCV